MFQDKTDFIHQSFIHRQEDQCIIFSLGYHSTTGFLSATRRRYILADVRSSVRPFVRPSVRLHAMGLCDDSSTELGVPVTFLLM